MICKNCNAIIDDNSRFCTSCGQKVEAKPAAAPAFQSAFYHAGSSDGSSVMSAPVVDKKLAIPQEDGELRFSSSFKRKNEAPAAHKSDIPHTELPSSMYANYNPHCAVNENCAAGSRPNPAPDYPAPAAAKKVHTPQENPDIRVLSTFTPDNAAPEANKSNKPVYPYTQANGPSVAAKMASPAPKKRSVWKYVCAGILALVVVLVSMFFITKAQSPWFEVNSAGKLSFDEDVWEFYHFYNTDLSVLIPKEYDGEINKISPDDSLKYFTLRYEGSLEEFLEEHPWAIQMMKENGRGEVECRDYVLSYNKNAHGRTVFFDDDGMPHSTEIGCYDVSKELEGSSITFHSMGPLLRWLDTGMYEYSYTDYFGETHYEEAKVTLD